MQGNNTSNNTDGGALNRMQGYASQGRIEELYHLIQQLTKQLEGRQLGEVYLYSAQLKLFLLDPTLSDDLHKAAGLLGGKSGIPPFLQIFKPLDPNSFILFEPRLGSVQAFQDTLHDVGDLLRGLCGPAGGSMARQLESDILYYRGKLRLAQQIAVEQFEKNLELGQYSFAMMAGYTLVRSRLALGDAEGVSDIVQKLILLSKNEEHPNLACMYKTIRTWLNLTTGWSGDTPRFNITPTGREYPVFDDRLDAIREGFGQSGPTEAPFEHIAGEIFPQVCNMRELYMDIFAAMQQVRGNYVAVFGSTFRAVYTISADNNILMPFVEYGGQIVPLLEYIMREDTENVFDREWVAAVYNMAGAYERGLESFRG